MRTLTLIRDSDDGLRTMGTMKAGNKTFFTLEEPWKGNAQGISAIPKGTYTVVPHNWGPPYSGQKQKDCYGLLDVPGRSGVCIHSGNTVLDIEGCILVGLSKGKLKCKDGVTRDAVLESKPALALLKGYMGKEPWMIEIK